MTHGTSTTNGFRATAASGQQAGNLVLQGREAFFAQNLSSLR